MKVIWAPLAMDRTVEIAEYIAQDNPDAAEQWVEDLFIKVQILGSQPRCGRVVPEISRDDIRELIYGNYRVIYWLTETRISILTVRHGVTDRPNGATHDRVNGASKTRHF